MKRTPLEELFYYIKIISYSLSAIFAGYTVVDLQPDFLEKFTKIEYQIFIIFILVAGFFDFRISEWKSTIIHIIILTIILTFILQLLRYYKKPRKTTIIEELIPSGTETI
jgi:phosphoglycerol transferase MdoB-like AlkP superfamily enzyme|tara:strand:- start:1604 stop:1933 length:330 start_codon:yes stop_codon:yes gene_type:complete